MDKATEPPKPGKKEKRRGRGKVTPRVSVEEQVIKAEIPPGSRFKGHEPFLVQDLVISVTRDLLPARTLGHARWTDDPGPVAGGDRGPFRSGTPPLRADAIPSGAVDAAPAAGVVAIGGGVDLEAAVATPVDRETRGLRRRSPGCSARRAGDIAVGVAWTTPARAMPGRTAFARRSAMTGSPGSARGHRRAG